jgi:molybdopterin synthase sulfur carrier subunit
MALRVKFFASLVERVGRRECEVPFRDGMSVLEVWRAATGTDTVPERILTAVNMEYCDADTVVRDGEEVAFFPPITGG